jgi:hypothetical protein
MDQGVLQRYDEEDQDKLKLKCLSCLLLLWYRMDLVDLLCPIYPVRK